MNHPERALETLQSLADCYTPAEEPQQVLYLSGLAYLALQASTRGKLHGRRQPRQTDHRNTLPPG